MKLNQNTLIVSVLIIAIVVGVIFAPPAIRSFFDGARDLFADVRDAFFEDWGSDLNLTTHNVGMNIIIYFADGTTKEIEPQPFSIFPLTVFFEGKEFTKIAYEGSAKLSWTGGSLTSMSVEGTFSPVIGTTEGGLPEYLTGKAIDKSISPIPEQDTWFVVDSFEISETNIENVIKEWGQGEREYIVKTLFNILITVTFEDGQVSDKRGTVIVDLHINYSESKIVALSVSVSSQPS